MVSLFFTLDESLTEGTRSCLCLEARGLRGVFACCKTFCQGNERTSHTIFLSNLGEDASSPGIWAVKVPSPPAMPLSGTWIICFACMWHYDPNPNAHCWDFLDVPTHGAPTGWGTSFPLHLSWILKEPSSQLSSCSFRERKILSSEQHCQETPSNLHSQGYAGWPNTPHVLFRHPTSRNTLSLGQGVLPISHFWRKVSGLGSQTWASGIPSCGINVWNYGYTDK